MKRILIPLLVLLLVFGTVLPVAAESAIVTDAEGSLTVYCHYGQDPRLKNEAQFDFTIDRSSPHAADENEFHPGKRLFPQRKPD